MVSESNNEILKTQDGYLPGQKYDVDKQCEMSSGEGYAEVKVDIKILF